VRLEHRRSKDIQPENTSPQPFDPIREKKREQTPIPNEDEAKCHINTFDRRKSEAGEYARSKLTPKEVEALKSYNRKRRRNQRKNNNNEKYTKEEKEAYNKDRRLRDNLRKIQGYETKQEKSREEPFLEGLPEADKQALHEIANFCNKYGLKETEKMFDLGYEIHLESMKKYREDEKGGGNNYRDYMDKLDEYKKESLKLYGRWKNRYKSKDKVKKDKVKKEFERIYELYCHMLLDNAEIFKKRKTASDKQSDNDVHKHLKLDQSGNSGVPLEQSDPSYEKREEGGKNGDGKAGGPSEAEEQEIAAREQKLANKKKRSRLKSISEFYEKTEEGEKSVDDNMGGHSKAEEQGKRGEDIPWGASSDQRPRTRSQRKRRQEFSGLQMDGSKQAQAEREQRPAIGAQHPEAVGKEQATEEPQGAILAGTHQKDAEGPQAKRQAEPSRQGETDHLQNENKVMYRVKTYDRKKTEAGQYARSKLTPEQIVAFTNYSRRQKNNSKNPDKKESPLHEEKEAINAYIYHRKQYHSQCQKNQGKETKQEKSRGESFLEGLPPSDKQAVLELASFCKIYGLKKAEEMFDVGYKISKEYKANHYKDHKKVGKNVRDYMDKLDEYKKESFNLYGRWCQSHRSMDKAKKEFEKICILFGEYRSLLENAESSKKRKAVSDKKSDNKTQKRLKLDQSGNSGEPLERSDPFHEKTEEGGKSVGGKTGGHSEVEEQGMRGEDIPWGSPSDHPVGRPKKRSQRKRRQEFSRLQMDGSKQAQAEREHRPAIEAQDPQATELEPENISPKAIQSFDPTHEKNREQNLIPNENKVLYRVGGYNRKITEAGKYARSKLTEEELVVLANYNRKSTNNSRNPDRNEEFTKEEKEARKKYRYYWSEYKRCPSEIQRNQGKETKQEKSRGESFLQGLSEADVQAFHELDNFCDDYGFEKTKEMFSVGHGIDLKRKRISRKNGKEVDNNASNYIKNLPNYHRESYKIFKRWQQRHQSGTKAKKEFERIYKLCCHMLLENAESFKKRKAASDKQSDNDAHKHLKLDQSGNSGEPLEHAAPPHEKTEEGGKSIGGKTGGPSEVEEQGMRGEADHSDQQVVPPGRVQALSHAEHLDLEVGRGQQSVSTPVASHHDSPNYRDEPLSRESPLDCLGDIQLPDDLNGIDFSNGLRDIDFLDLESISTPVASHFDHPTTSQHESRSIERDLLDQQSVSTPVENHLDYPNAQHESLPSERGLEGLSEGDNERDSVDHHEARLEREAPSLSHEETLILKHSFIYPIRKDGRIRECRIGAGKPESSDRAFLDLTSKNPYFLYFTDDPNNDVYALNPQRYLLISPKAEGCELLSKREAIAYLQGKNQAIEQLRGYPLLAPSGAESGVDISSVSSNGQIIPDLQAGERSLLDPGDVSNSRFSHQEGNPFSAQFSAEETVGGSKSDAGQIFSQGEHAGSQCRLRQDEERVFQALNGFLLEEDDASASHDPVQVNDYINALIAGGGTAGDENRLFPNDDGLPSSAKDHLPDIWNQWPDLLTEVADADLSSFEHPSDVNHPYTDRSEPVSPFLDDNSSFDGLHHISVSGEGNNCGPRALLTVAHYDPGTGSWEEGWNEERVEQIVTEVRTYLRSIPWNGPHGEITMAGRDGCDDFLEMGDEPGMQVVAYLQSKCLLDANRDVIVTDRHAGGQLSSHMIAGDANHPSPNPYRIYLDYEGHHFSAQFPAEEAVRGSESDADQILSQGEYMEVQGEGREG
jgi:hypothetical protein